MKINLYFKYFLCLLFLTGMFFELEGCKKKTPDSGDSTEDSTDDPTDVPSDVGDYDYFIDANNHCIGKVLTKISDDRYQVISPKNYVTDISSTHFNILKDYMATTLITEDHLNDLLPSIQPDVIESLDNGIWKDYKDKLYQQAVFYDAGDPGTANAFYDYQKEEKEDQKLFVNNNKSQASEFQGVTPKFLRDSSTSQPIASILRPSKKVDISNKQDVLDATGFLVDWAAPATVVEEDAGYDCAGNQS